MGSGQILTILIPKNDKNPLPQLLSSESLGANDFRLFTARLQQAKYETPLYVSTVLETFFANNLTGFACLEGHQQFEVSRAPNAAQISASQHR